MHYLVSDTDIVWRKEFISCNILIDGKLLKNLQERPTNHTEIINTADVENIFSYLYVNLTPAAKNELLHRQN